jgi:hypothetical protein
MQGKNHDSYIGVSSVETLVQSLLIQSGSQQEPITLSASQDQNFTHATFNETGDLLFAWAYGHKDTLYIWRCQDRVMNQATESESRYETVNSFPRFQSKLDYLIISKERVGNPNLTKVIPYNTYQGCIIARPDKRFSPAQIHSSLRGKKETLTRNNEIKLSDFHSACIFNDHSMITIEKGMFHRHSYLKEYKIDYKSTHLLIFPGTEICRMISSTDPLSQVLAVKNDESIVIIVCNMDATIEFINIVPATTNQGFELLDKHNKSKRI